MILVYLKRDRSTGEPLSLLKRYITDAEYVEYCTAIEIRITDGKYEWREPGSDKWPQ